MIRYEEIWKEYISGKLEPETSVTSNDNLALSVKDLSSFKTQSLDDRINVLTSSNKPSEVFTQLSSVSKTLGEFQEKYDSFIESGRFSDSWLKRKVVEVIKTGHKLDKTIEHFQNKSFESFNEAYSNIKTSKGIDFLKSEREKADLLYASTLDLNSLLVERGVPKSTYSKLISTLTQYASLQNDIQEIDAEIDSLTTKLTSIDLTSDLKILSEIIKKSGSYLFGKSSLDKANKINYLEGSYKLNLINEESIDFKNNPEKYFSLKNEIKKHISSLDEFSSWLDVDRSSISLSDMSALETFPRSNSPDKYNSPNSVYLQNLIDSYSEKASLVNSQAKEYISEFKSKSFTKEKSKPISNYTTSGYFNFYEELADLPRPSFYELNKLSDVLTGKSGSENGLLSVMNSLGKICKQLESNSNIISDYPLKVYSVLKKYYDVGYLGELASFSVSNKQIIDTSLNVMHSYAIKVAP